MSSRKQLLAFAVVALGVLGAAGLLSAAQGELFQAYFGNVHPLLAVSAVTAVGFFSLSVLNTGSGFKIFRVETYPKGLVHAVGFATLFAIPVVAADIALGYPRDINVALPHALLFYPTMGFVAEIAFHTFPLSVLLFVLGLLFANTGINRLIWSCILLSSLIEPTFQLSFALAENNFSPVDVYTCLHVFIFNVVQLHFFWRHDFMTMFFFRMVYYLHWHILWGHIRLEFLF